MSGIVDLILIVNGSQVVKSIGYHDGEVITVPICLDEDGKVILKRPDSANNGPMMTLSGGPVGNSKTTEAAGPSETPGAPDCESVPAGPHPE